jgi:hypothetical protein
VSEAALNLLIATQALAIELALARRDSSLTSAHKADPDGRRVSKDVSVDTINSRERTADPGNLTFAGGRRDAQAPEGF